MNWCVFVCVCVCVYGVVGGSLFTMCSHIFVYALINVKCGNVITWIFWSVNLRQLDNCYEFNIFFSSSFLPSGPKCLISSRMLLIILITDKISAVCNVPNLSRLLTDLPKSKTDAK